MGLGACEGAAGGQRSSRRDDDAVLHRQLRVNCPRAESAPQSEKQALFLLLQPGSRGTGPKGAASGRCPPHWHSLPGRRSCPSARDSVLAPDARHSHPQASGPLSPPLPEHPLQYGGTGGGGAPPRVRFWLLQDLLTPRPQTHVGLCDAPRKRKIQASTVCCPRAPRTWPSWNLRPGEKVAQLRSEGSPSPGHAKQKGASLAGLGAPVAWAGCFLLHSDLVLWQLLLHSADPVLRWLLLHSDLVLRL